MSWVPTTDFEDEIVSLQPDHNFIYGTLSAHEPEQHMPRPASHLAYAAKKQELAKSRQSRQNSNAPTTQNGKLFIIEKVQQIAGTNRLGEQATVHDWDDVDPVERETVAMMRHFGLGPSIEEPITDKCTLPTLPISDGLRVNHNGHRRMPVYLDDYYFKFKPRVANTTTKLADESTSSTKTESTSLSGSSSDSDSNRISNKTYDIPSSTNGANKTSSDDSFYTESVNTSSSSCYTARSTTSPSSCNTSYSEEFTSPTVPLMKTKKKRGKPLVSNSISYKRL